MANTFTRAPVGAAKDPNRWTQLVIGIICMGLVANLQYAWTLFVVPMDAKHHRGRPRSRPHSPFSSSPKPGWFRSKAGSSTSSGRVPS